MPKSTEGAMEDIVALMAHSHSQILTPDNLVVLATIISDEVARRLRESAQLPENQVIGGKAIGALQASVSDLIKATLTFVEDGKEKATEQLTPSELAYQMVINLRKKAKIEKEKKAKKIESIHTILISLFGQCLTQTLNDDDKLALLPPAEELASKDGIRMKEVIQRISGNRYIQIRFGLLKHEITGMFQSEDNESITGKLRAELKSHEGPSNAFENLIGQRMIGRHAKFRISSKEADTLGADANELAEQLLIGDPLFKLDEEVIRTHDPDMLQKMLTAVPVTPKELKKVQSANIKLMIMRAQHLVDTQTNTDYEREVIVELKRLLNGIIHITQSGEMILNPPRDSNGNAIDTPLALANNDRWTKIGRIKIPEEPKSKESKVRKIILSDKEEANTILDCVRFSITVSKADTPRDIKNLPEDADGLTEFDKRSIKIIGILVSLFGGRPFQDKSRYSLLNGGENANSTGGFLSINHIWPLRHQSKNNPFDSKTGKPITQTTAVEGQVVAYMSELEADEDHNEYKKNRNKAIAEKAGATLSFDEFAVDLMESIQSKHDFGYRSVVQKEQDSSGDQDLEQFHKNNLGVGDIDLDPEGVDIKKLLESREVKITHNYENLILLFFEILTRKKEGSNHLENYETLLYLLSYHKAQIRNVINICSRWSINRGQSKFSVLIEQKAKILDGIIKSSQDKAATTSLKLHNRAGTWSATSTVDFGGNRQIHRTTPYNGPIGISETRSGNVKEYQEIYNKRRNKKATAYRIIENEDGTIECFRIFKSAKEPLHIWKLIPSEHGYYIPCRTIYAHMTDENGECIFVQSDIEKMPSTHIRKTRTGDTLSEIDPTVGMTPHNKKMYEAVKNAGRR